MRLRLVGLRIGLEQGVWIVPQEISADRLVAPMAEGAGALEAVSRLASITLFLNLVLFLFNLVPLPPLDGGHVAIGTYERLRSIGGRKHEVDYARVLPLTYAVFAFLVVIGVFALARDIIDPIDIG